MVLKRPTEPGLGSMQRPQDAVWALKERPGPQPCWKLLGSHHRVLRASWVTLSDAQGPMRKLGSKHIRYMQDRYPKHRLCLSLAGVEHGEEHEDRHGDPDMWRVEAQGLC